MLTEFSQTDFEQAMLIPSNKKEAMMQRAAEAKIMAELAHIRHIQNNIRLSTFKKYAIIFSYDGVASLSKEKHEELVAEWDGLIDKYLPVNIIDDYTNEIVLTLPAIFNRVDEVNRLAIGKDIITAFAIANNQEQDNFSQKRGKYANYLGMAIEEAQDESRRNATKQETSKLLTEFESKLRGEKTHTETVSLLSDLNIEEIYEPL